MAKEKYKIQSVDEIKKIILEILPILKSVKNLEFEKIDQHKRDYIIKNAPKLQNYMEYYGFGINESIFKGFKNTKMIENLQDIFSTKTLFDIYTKNEIAKAHYTKIIVEIENFLDELEKNIEVNKEERVADMITKEIGRDVFVIHGRNLKIRDSMFELLRNLDLHPVPFEEAKQKTKEGSPYNLDVLRKAIIENVTVLALMTPDDIAYLKPSFHTKYDTEDEKKPMGQARPNVIFETGFAFAINPKRTIIIIFGNVRKYSDIAGINYLHFEDTPKSRNELKELLKSIGCPIRENSNYLTVGNFKIEEEILKNIPFSSSYIINLVKSLRDLCILIVRNEYDEKIEEKFRSLLIDIHQFPEVEAQLPNYLSQESNSDNLHKFFKTQGSYDERVKKINADFESTLRNLKM